MTHNPGNSWPPPTSFSVRIHSTVTFQTPSAIAVSLPHSIKPKIVLLRAPSGRASILTLRIIPSPSPLVGLQARWLLAKPDLVLLRSPAETDLPDAIMDVVFQIEQQTSTTCGSPQGLDLALLMISHKREAISQ